MGWYLPLVRSRYPHVQSMIDGSFLGACSANALFHALVLVCTCGLLASALKGAIKGGDVNMVGGAGGGVPGRLSGSDPTACPRPLGLLPQPTARVAPPPGSAGGPRAAGGGNQRRIYLARGAWYHYHPAGSARQGCLPREVHRRCPPAQHATSSRTVHRPLARLLPTAPPPPPPPLPRPTPTPPPPPPPCVYTGGGRLPGPAPHRVRAAQGALRRRRPAPGQHAPLLQAGRAGQPLRLRGVRAGKHACLAASCGAAADVCTTVQLYLLVGHWARRMGGQASGVQQVAGGDQDVPAHALAPFITDPIISWVIYD